MSPCPLKPYSQLTPAGFLTLCPEVIAMATWFLVGAGPAATSPRAQPCLVLSLQVPAQTSAPGAISSQLTIWSLKWFLCFSMGVTCVYTLMFTSLERKPKNSRGRCSEAEILRCGKGCHILREAGCLKVKNMSEIHR